jgi:hypothetical protein
MDVIGILIFTCGFILWIVYIIRYKNGYVLDEDQDNYFIASRIVLSIDVLVWFLRSLEYCLLFKTVGPKLAVLKESVRNFF